MQTSTCPECGEAIGGSSHRLLHSNRNDLEMDRIAMEEGAMKKDVRRKRGNRT